MLAGNEPYIPTDFIAIQTVTLTGTQSTVEFTSIPSTFRHLQIRLFARTDRPTYGTSTLAMRINNVSTSTYSHKFIVADGSGSLTLTAAANISSMDLGNNTLGSTVSNSFGAVVIDILDYNDTNKLKTVRSIGGVDINGAIAGFGGHTAWGSGLFQSSSAVSSIQLFSAGLSFTQHSRFALYGIRG